MVHSYALCAYTNFSSSTPFKKKKKKLPNIVSGHLLQKYLHTHQFDLFNVHAALSLTKQDPTGIARLTGITNPSLLCKVSTKQI